MAKLSIKIVVIHECGTESMYNKIHDGQVLFFFLKRDWDGNSAIPVVPAVTHVRGFLVRRQVELLFLCPQVLLCLITARVCSSVCQFSPEVCVALVNISLC